MVKDSRPVSIEQKRWQDLVSGIVISFEVICCLLAQTNPIMLVVGVGGAIGFALLFFNRQFREKYLGYQGDRSQPVISIPIFKTTAPKIEQSLLLWAMVVLLAITAYIGLDLATHTAFSFLAIPFSIAGSLWSYRRRYLHNHLVTYLISALAIGLIFFCMGSAFWGQTIEKAKSFLGTDRDLVLPLASSFLLVALQSAWMWSLCYQRRLAGSVVISSMLMITTVVIGNNLGFLVVLALFMGLLVTTLMLFYRSTINLKPIGLSIVPRPQQLTERHVAWKYLTKIALTSVVLGCILSLFAPQLRLPDVSWDWPGVDQVLKNLPIQTDPDFSNPSQSEGDQQPEITEQPNAEGAMPAPENDQDSGLMDEQLARQAIQNILATADRPLITKAERRAYLQQYLREHIQSPDCSSNNSDCFNSSFGDGVNRDQLADQQQTGLARWGPTAQIPVQPYYLAQQPTPAPLIRQLTASCPVNQPNCYKDRFFQANKKESVRTRLRLLKSIGGTDLTDGNSDHQSSSQKSESAGNSSGQGGNPGDGSAGNFGGQGSNSGFGSAENSGGQEGNPSFGSPGNAGAQGGSQNPGFSGNAGDSGGHPGLRFPGSSTDRQGSNPGFRFPWNRTDEPGGDRGSRSPDRHRQNSNPDAKTATGKNADQRQGATDKSSSGRDQKATPKNVANLGKDPIPKPDRAKPRSENSSGNPAEQKKPDQPPKLPPVNAEQLTNLLRICAVILLMVAAVAWYLRLQNRQEKIAKQKERKFNQLPTIERIYWLMLKELRTSGSIKHSHETEWEFALGKTQQPNNQDLQYPGLLGKLITEISGDYVAWRYGKKPANDTSLSHKFERFRELHREFCAAEQAKRTAATRSISPAKRHLVM